MVPMELEIRPTNEKMPRSLSILIVDKFPAIVEGTRQLLEQQKAGQFRVSGATNLEQAVWEMKDHAFDCVLLDLHFPNFMKAISRLHKCSPTAKILIFTYDDPAPYFNQIIKAGAVGFVSKNCSPEQLADSIIAAASGHSSVPIQLIRELRRTVLCIDHPDGVKWEEISEREEELLHYLALGYTYKESAAKMYLSQRSIENLVSGLCRKLNVASRKEMMIKAREVKLLPRNPAN